MKYTICSREKDIMSMMWNVFASFGYKDAVVSENSSGEAGDVKRLAVDNGLKCSILLLNCINKKAMSEIAAVSVEAALAVGFPDFCLEITCPEEVADILYLYSLDEYYSISVGEFSITGKSGEYKIFSGKCDCNGITCEFDLAAASDALKDEHVSNTIPETVIFTELDADGIGYEIAYTMRLSGCLVTTYLGEGTIEDCEKYAKDRGAESVIRVFADGKIQIKEIADNVITETDYNTFIGYYDDVPEDDCGCGHDHYHGTDHHGHECDCGHCH